MTVYTTKNEIDIRDKLNELDFGKVPSQKMPTGSIVGVSQKRFDTRISINHNNVLQFYSFNDLNTVVYPKSKESKFLCFADVVSSEGKNPNGGPAFAYFVGNGVRTFGPHAASEHSYNWQIGTSAFVEVDDLITTAFTTSGNNWQYLTKTYHGSVLFEPKTTDKVTIQLGYHGMTTFDVNRNSYTAVDAYGSGWTTLTVMEILA
jgi:hypothetical protein